MSYTVEEVGGDQLELSGTYGYIGLILQLRVTFNNFSAQNLFHKDAWRPLPMGDGQQLSLGVQTSGLAYQSYSLSFTEPWFRGKPTPIGFATSYSRYDFNRFNRVGSTANATDTTGFNGYAVGNLRGFLNRRLKFPDDKFEFSSGLGYRYYYVTASTLGLPTGTNHEGTVDLAPLAQLAGQPALPALGLVLQPVAQRRPADSGLYPVPQVGPADGVEQPARAQDHVRPDHAARLHRLVHGQGRALPALSARRLAVRLLAASTRRSARTSSSCAATRPRRSGRAAAGAPVGGRILNKYTTEVRWLAIASPQLQAAPYVFADAANTWDGFGSFNPAQLYRSAGVGTRLYLPILGMIELAYGESFDRFPALSGSEDGTPKWRFQFSIGQGFNQ